MGIFEEMGFIDSQGETPSKNKNEREGPVLLKYSSLFVIHHGQEMPKNATPIEGGNGEPFPQYKHLNPCFKEIKHLRTVNLVSDVLVSAENQNILDFKDQILQFKRADDLEMLLEMECKSGSKMYVAMGENWNFDMIRKLPWKFHEKGLTPYFFEANKNFNGQNDKQVYRRLYSKGVLMPIDIISVVLGNSNPVPWWKILFAGQKAQYLMQKSAQYLMDIQVTPPYYIRRNDVEQLNQWVREGVVKFVE